MSADERLAENVQRAEETARTLIRETGIPVTLAEYFDRLTYAYSLGLRDGANEALAAFDQFVTEERP